MGKAVFTVRPVWVTNGGRSAVVAMLGSSVRVLLCYRCGCRAAATVAAAAVLLVSCCCADAVATYGYLISVFLKKYAVLRDANRSSLFSIRDLYFLWSHGISAIRSSQTQLVKVMLE